MGSFFLVRRGEVVEEESAMESRLSGRPGGKLEGGWGGTEGGRLLSWLMGREEEEEGGYGLRRSMARWRYQVHPLMVDMEEIEAAGVRG